MLRAISLHPQSRFLHLAVSRVLPLLLAAGILAAGAVSAAPPHGGAGDHAG